MLNIAELVLRLGSALINSVHSRNKMTVRSSALDSETLPRQSRSYISKKDQVFYSYVVSTLILFNRFIDNFQ
jgi:hypothetical protein